MEINELHEHAPMAIRQHPSTSIHTKCDFQRKRTNTTILAHWCLHVQTAENRAFPPAALPHTPTETHTLTTQHMIYIPGKKLHNYIHATINLKADPKIYSHFDTIIMHCTIKIHFIIYVYINDIVYIKHRHVKNEQRSLTLLTA